MRKSVPTRAHYTRLARRYRECQRALECLIAEKASDAAIAEFARASSRVHAEWMKSLRAFFKAEDAEAFPDGPRRLARQAEWDARRHEAICVRCGGFCNVDGCNHQVAK